MEKRVKFKNSDRFIACFVNFTRQKASCIGKNSFLFWASPNINNLFLFFILPALQSVGTETA